SKGKLVKEEYEPISKSSSKGRDKDREYSSKDREFSSNDRDRDRDDRGRDDRSRDDRNRSESRDRRRGGSDDDDEYEVKEKRRDKDTKEKEFPWESPSNRKSGLSIDTKPRSSTRERPEGRPSTAGSPRKTDGLRAYSGMF
ncbi:UNVERIFIED_CONTAM: hypothetical protein HDU68_000129, partial [Siphonaria sp. JEL0065]